MRCERGQMADGESTWRARRGEYGCGYTSVATVLGAEVVAGAAVLHIEHKYLFVLDCISLHHTYTHTSSSSRSSTTAAYSVRGGGFTCSFTRSSARSFSQRGQPEIADNAMVRGADGQLVTFPGYVLRVRSQQARRATPKTIQSTRCMVLRPSMRKVTASMAEVCVFPSGRSTTRFVGRV